jgi:2-dehydropantoate 2-reductase
MARFVIVGAGAIGGVVGARLFEAGTDVTLVARGEHGRAIAESGLTLVEPDRTVTVRVPVVASVGGAGIGSGDLVVLAVKSQDTPTVLTELAGCAPPSTPVCCFQNGVANERVVAARFDAVYGVVVMMPASHLEPGRVVAFSALVPGLFDIGLATGEVDDTASAAAAALGGAGFDARTVPAVMRWKYTKLLMNLGNAVDAICPADDDAIRLVVRARDEATACFDAAGIDYASGEEERERRGDLLRPREIAGTPRGGGSSWQSLTRGLGSIEADAFNGEVVRVGAAVGVPTPVNSLLSARAQAAAAARIAPRSIPAADLLAALD